MKSVDFLPSKFILRKSAFDPIFAICFVFNKCYQPKFAGSICSMADAESIDQKLYFEQLCKPKCAKPLLLYKACAQRIQGDESGHKHCTGQYFDYWSCVDKCVASKLFATFK